MLKITEIEGQGSRHILKLEGKLVGPWVAEVKEVCEKKTDNSGQTILDLAGLMFVDQAGTKLLEELIVRGIVISACSGFVAELLRWEKS
jgi:anti-anti-sigma regulatory factor